MKSDRLIQACRDDNTVLTSILAWLDEEREKLNAPLEQSVELNEILRLQGEARALAKLKSRLPAMCRIKPRS